jgi:hypothetical protein
MPSVQLELEELGLRADELESGEAVVGADACSVTVGTAQLCLDLLLECAKRCGKPFRALLFSIAEEELASFRNVVLGLTFPDPPLFRSVAYNSIPRGATYQEGVNLMNASQYFVL